MNSWSNDVRKKILARAGVIVAPLLAVTFRNEAYMKWKKGNGPKVRFSETLCGWCCLHFLQTSVTILPRQSVL